jgi:hypothetical protein
MKAAKWLASQSSAAFISGGRWNLLRLALENGDSREMLVRGTEVGPDGERPFELDSRLVVPADEREELPQRIVRVGLVGRHVGVGAELFLRLGELRLRHRQVSQVVARQDPVRIDLEEARVELGCGAPVLAIPGLAGGDVERPGIFGVAREIPRADLRLPFARDARQLDQEALAFVEERKIDRLELLAQALALLAVGRDRRELNLRRRELRVELERLAEVRCRLEQVEAHPRVEPGLESLQRAGRARRPIERLLPENVRHDDRCRRHSRQRHRDQHDIQCATSHASPPPSRAMATRVMSS